MLQVPDYLAILQWCLLALLAALIVLMYRQLAVYLELTGGPARPTYGPAVGTAVTNLAWTTSEGDQRTLDPLGQPTMLLIADPTCETCNHALEVLEGMRADDLVKQVRLLVLTKEPPVFVAASPTFRDSSYPIGYIEGHTVDRLDAHMTPLAISVGADGRVRTSGAAWTADQLRLYCARALSEIGVTASNATNSLPVTQAG